MAIIQISDITISYPTPDDGAAPEPIISHAESHQYAVSLRLDAASEPAALNATIRRQADGSTRKITLNEEQVRFIDQQTRQREIVGVIQWRYALTFLQWLEDGEIAPFTGDAAQYAARKSA